MLVRTEFIMNNYSIYSALQHFNVALVFLLVSVCCDTTQALVSCWCQCVVTRPKPWYLAGVSVL